MTKCLCKIGANQAQGMTHMGGFPGESGSILVIDASWCSDVLSDVLMLWTGLAHDWIMRLFVDRPLGSGPGVSSIPVLCFYLFQLFLDVDTYDSFLGHSLLTSSISRGPCCP
jgi:hypothetical protein